MNRKSFLSFILLAATVGGSVACGSQTGHSDADGHSAEKRPVRAADHAPKAKPVPAFQTAEEAKNLKPTLSPERFQGNVRAAYAAVQRRAHEPL